MKHFFLIALLLIPVLCYCQKTDKEDKIDTELTKCLDKSENQTTAGMCNCTYEALGKWDKKLNTIYKSLLYKLDSTAKIKLVEAQRQWIKFKEKEVALIDETYGKAQGTMWRVSRADKVLQVTRNRALELEELLETVDEF